MADGLTQAQFALEPVLTAAWLYYEEGLKQDEIAARFSISRASVFNLLQKARDEGVVSVSIDLSRMEMMQLAAELRETMGLRECFVVPRSGADEPVLQRIARLGARVLEQHLSPDTVLGVAWGRTVMALSKALTALHLPNTTIAQVTGSSIATYDFSPELCTSNIALKLGGRCANLHAPGIVSSPRMKELLMDEPIIAQHFRLLRSCTATLFGVTHLRGETLLHDSGFMTMEMLEEYDSLGAVGFASGYFYDEAGNAVQGEIDERHIKMPREDFLQVPLRICVGGGPSKGRAIRGMLNGGYANVLVTDEDTACAVLDGAVAKPPVLRRDGGE